MHPEFMHLTNQARHDDLLREAEQRREKRGLLRRLRDLHPARAVAPAEQPSPTLAVGQDAQVPAQRTAPEEAPAPAALEPSNVEGLQHGS
jgi:hypothetical protein